jgi:hypothetical protein
LGDAKLFNRARRQFRDHLDRNLLPDGEPVDFRQRDALHYVVYDLEPLVRAAMAARLRGEDWLRVTGETGRSLALGLEWLTPYARGEQTHHEFVRTKVEFDRQRQVRGVPGFNGIWDRKRSTHLYWLATTLDPVYRKTAISIAPAPSWIIACWQLEP